MGHRPVSNAQGGQVHTPYKEGLLHSLGAVCRALIQERLNAGSVEHIQTLHAGVQEGDRGSQQTHNWACALAVKVHHLKSTEDCFRFIAGIF